MPTDLLDPEVLARVQKLELTARQIVDGFMAGAHASPSHGFAVEFAHHREYVPGDDIKHLDWKVFGRTERFYLKQYQLETDFTCWLVVDGSGSMRYSSHDVSKYDYACILAATLAYVVVRQGDRVGLSVADATIERFVRASGAGNQLGEVVRQLALGPTNQPSQLGLALGELAGRIGRRGIVFVFSDFFDDIDELIKGFHRLRFDRHDIIAVTVVDPAELDFPFTAATKFKGLEIPEELLTDPRGLRQAYLDELHGHRDRLHRRCRELGVHLLECRTNTDPGRTLAHFLAERS
jgi:uncharacterized protein (DUF58 family)